jgi:serpin B
MHRRDVLRLLSLSTLAVAGGSLLAACAAEDGARRPTVGDVDLVVDEGDRQGGDPAGIPAVVAALDRSGGALFGQLADEHDNLALSPFSISVALAMTANGAGGETRSQLETAIGDLGVDDANAGLAALGRHVESLAGTRRKQDGKKAEIALDTADALFGQQGVRWEEPFLDTLARYYGGGLDAVDWKGATEAARAAVNAWTAERTRDKIPEILPEGSVDTTTRLVLVNTLYLEAPWEHPFEKLLTEDADFHLADGTTVRTPMMRGLEPFPADAASGPGWQAVRLPYAGRELAMTVVLPDADRFDDVQAEVVAGRLGQFLEVPARDAPLSVEVSLPRFTFRTAASLKPPLRELGVEVPFGPDADFSAMTAEDLDLYVSDVLHQVFVAVDEEGTEAAAATAVVMSELSAAVGSDLELVVDRPFLFVVHDVAHGTPLFVGRVLDPRS